MTIRFTETEKWRDKWFRKLNPTEKLLFLYIIENCDGAGFIEIDEDYWSFMIGIDTDEIKEAIQGLTKSIEVQKNFIWVKNFLQYQRNLPLNENNNAHKKIIACLRMHPEFGAALSLLAPNDDNEDPNEADESLYEDELAPKARGIGISNCISRGRGRGKSNINTDDEIVFNSKSDIPDDMPKSENHPDFEKFMDAWTEKRFQTVERLGSGQVDAINSSLGARGLRWCLEAIASKGRTPKECFFFASKATGADTDTKASNLKLLERMNG